MQRWLPILLASAAANCSVQKIAPPFPEDMPYGSIVREIRIEGDDFTRSRIVRSAMASRPGKPYTEKTARNDYLWLSRLGIFTSIAFRTEQVSNGIVLVVEW